MPYRLLHRDITQMRADAIISPANTKPVCTPGVEMEIYQVAGYEDMLSARRELGDLECG